MIPFIKDCYFISRKDSVLIANLTDGTQVPLVIFKQKFVDLLIVEKQAYQYMQDYMQMFPELWEYYKEEVKQGEQIQLEL